MIYRQTIAKIDSIDPTHWGQFFLKVEIEFLSRKNLAAFRSEEAQSPLENFHIDRSVV